jgi:hypothetical protein
VDSVHGICSCWLYYVYYFPFMPTCANLYNISNFKIHNFEIFYMKNQYFRIADDSVNNRVLSLVTNINKKKVVTEIRNVGQINFYRYYCCYSSI